MDEDLLVRVPHPQAVSLAETILKAGIHQYPESEFLLIVQTGLRVHLKKDKPVCRKVTLRCLSAFETCLLHQEQDVLFCLACQSQRTLNII